MANQVAKQDHPYANLPGSRFWKQAVDDFARGKILDLWRPKYLISRTDRIITAGSCFAQHISRHLSEAGFDWLAGEAAPAGLGSEQARLQGYGVFSFRTGNIYTSALLKQWVFMALGLVSCVPEPFYDGMRYYDPLRPGIPSEGYASLEELNHARTITLQSIRSVITDATLFIFTLGLTEYWSHIDGYVFPSCPGTIKGVFDPGKHRFNNQQYPQIVEDLVQTFDAIRKINPRIRFLLTVSPVPLTATASEHHVLSASTLSKSILRSVAGYLAGQYDDIDYFPSYELITTSLNQGKFFEANFRSVNEQGVRFVMRHFEEAIAGSSIPLGETKGVISPFASIPASPLASDAICEDAILEQWARPQTMHMNGKPAIVLLGDSHMSRLADQFGNIGVPVFGGGIMGGSPWHFCEFDTDSSRFFIARDKSHDQRWRAIYDYIKIYVPSKAGGRLTMLTNIGSQAHIMHEHFFNYLKTKYGDGPWNISFDELKVVVDQTRAPQFDIVKRMVKAGHRVLWVGDPPAQRFDEVFFMAVNTFLCELFQGSGATVFNAHDWVKKRGGWQEKYHSAGVDPVSGKADQVHGSDAYYRDLALAIADRIKIMNRR
ncbi:GSCFA domain-containing protein [Chitinimonas sp.]|uniref:GSCFA domain-containing protein n=1 Tax=Chitinimonas sp. TaxID=1934313 RepID=UPI0035AE8DA2